MFRTHVRESGRRIALLVSLLIAAGAPCGDRRPSRPRGDDPLPRPADGHPDDLLLGRAGHRRARVPLHAPRLQRRPRAAGDPAAVQRAPRATTRASSSSYTHNAADQWSLVSRSVACPTPSSSTPRTATSTSRWPPSASTRSPPTAARRAGRRLAQERLLHRRLLHLRHHRRARRARSSALKGSCADPTTLRGLTVGGADEYDYRDPGQAIPFDGVPDGTYWFRAITDPNNDFVEANEANNETDVKVTIAGSTVTAGQVLHPDTTPPSISWGAPADGTRVRGQRHAVGEHARRPAPAGSSSSSTATSSGSATLQPVHAELGLDDASSTASTGWPRARPMRRAGTNTTDSGGAHRRQLDAASGAGAARDRRHQERRRRAAR